MIRRDYQTIGDVLRQVISDASMDDRLQEVRAASLWPSVVGEHIASQCGKPNVAKGVMTICVRNAALRQELLMVRSSLVNSINRAVGKQVLTDIRLIY